MLQKLESPFGLVPANREARSDGGAAPDAAHQNGFDVGLHAPALGSRRSLEEVGAPFDRCTAGALPMLLCVLIALPKVIKA